MRVRGKDKIQAPPVFVSRCELTVGSPRIQAVLDKCGLDYVLHNLWGFDKNHVDKDSGTFYKIENCRFRNRSGKVIDGERIVGIERLDDEWIEQGRPSKEAEAFARQDLSYIAELQNLGKRIKSL